MFLLSVFLLSLSTTSTAFMFPKDCVPQPHLPGTCCPSYKGSPCGSALNRGSCLPVQRSRTETPTVLLDDRDRCPSFYFNVSCVCKDKFMGPDCGQCKFGRVGENCDQFITVVRREIRQFSVVERIQFFAKINYCKKLIDPRYYILRTGDRFQSYTYKFIDASYYDCWCYYHYYATKPFLQGNSEFGFLNYAHGSTGFGSWHRFFLLLLERQMQLCLKDPTFALAFYDWQDDPDCAICGDDMIGGNDKQGRISKYSIFSTWRTVCGTTDYRGTYCLMSDCICERTKVFRRPGMALGFGKPNRLDVQHCLTIPNIDTPPYDPSSSNSSRCCIEGWRDRNDQRGTSLHNLWHVYMGGTMSVVPIACNDLMFFLHHCFIDKIFDAHIRRWGITPASYPNVQVYGHRAYDCMCPFLECWYHRTMFTQSTTFGYRYDIYNNF